MTFKVIEGDCLAVMRDMDPSSVDACVTDPPYGLKFMGKGWDHAVPGVEFWRLAFDLLKPGAHLVAFSGTRTYHRMACAIEDAGFEIRDQLAWTYGSGFPKSHNLDGDWQGWGTALKPAWEPICLARKPLIGTVAANVLAFGTGAINVDGCRVVADDGDNRARPPRTPNEILGGGKGTNLTASPHNDLGRWPANLLHDGSDEVLAEFPEAAGATSNSTGASTWFAGRPTPTAAGHGDTGSAARFFYCAKASKKERQGSKHPTVKPLALMRWLCRLVTPPGGTILDPFAGTGTTLQAAKEEGFSSIGIEMTPEYVTDIYRRMAA